MSEQPQGPVDDLPVADDTGGSENAALPVLVDSPAAREGDDGPPLDVLPPPMDA
ncbi:hypothetical protein [Streptomyces beijiangensis]|uniref:hypothetical protein n=1 Tax=Streptomyces beijiangensis TaxID=163361 RepID=UPI001A8FBCF0|nr:hypothetical protein [Streptomyces beijiangensis]